MNNERRKLIDSAMAKIRDGLDELITAKDEEQDYYDNMPEGLQSGSKGDNAQSAIDSLDNAISDIDQALDSAEEAKNQ